jgi:K+-transporting ATPase ATPase A chain
VVVRSLRVAAPPVTFQGWAEILLAIGLAVGLAWPIGDHIGKVWAGEPTFLDPVIGPIERLFYRAAGIDPGRGQDWVGFALSMLAFNAGGFLVLYGILRLQGHLPLNPQHAPGMAPDLAFNVAIAFVTNTDWQAYVPERAAGHFAQMAGFTMQNFASAASGMSVAAALARAFATRGAKTIGNFWADLVRNVLYVLLPLSIVVTIVLVALGVPQTLAAHVEAHTLEGARQTILVGPVASQEAIKELGANGGGFFKANSAHPFENPSSLSNVVEIVAMATVGFACAVGFGRVVKARSDLRALTIVMASLVTVAAGCIYLAETQPTPALIAAHVTATSNMEGKETRFGAAGTAVFSAMTTGGSAGSVNAMHESFTPAGSGVPLFLMLIGGTLPGGVGSGISCMLVMAMLTTFLAGLLVGRTPEYLGKKIGAREIKLAMLTSIMLPASILGFSAIAASLPLALKAVSATGAHGLTEILYTYASTTVNNGSSFAGLNANTLYWNTTLGIAAALGRFGVAIPVLAIAGGLAAKPKLPPTEGTFPTDGPLFVVLVIAAILIVAGLLYFPALALGPIREHFEMAARLAGLR